jgi:proteasome lid subunit RPN8/RPN11
MKTDSIFIPKKIIGHIISYSLENDPDESCGMLQGTNSMVSKFFPMSNIHETPNNRYTMNPVEMIKVEDECDTAGESVIGIMHSHTHTQAYLSDTDVKHALTSGYLDQVYLVVSLVEKTRPVIRAFKLSEDGKISEIFIDFEGPKYISR